MPNYQWAVPANTNGFNGYWPNPGVKTMGIPMPVWRQDRFGDRRLYVGNLHIGYASGPASIWAVMYYMGYETEGDFIFPGTVGGVFDFAIRGSAGTLRFGRQEGTGLSVQSENEAFSWNGTLAGSFDYAEVALGLNVHYWRNGRNIEFSDWSVADNGGSTITQIRRQMQVNGGSWGSDTSLWGDTFVGTPGNTYRFRFYARNGVGDSAYDTGDVITIPYGGGRRMTGVSPSSSVPITIARRHDGTSWKDLTIKKRHNGSTWVDINN